MREAPSRVLMTADAIGGVWTYVLELASELSAAGSEVLVAVMGGGSREPVDIPNVRFVWSDWKLEWMPEPWDDVARAGDWLLKLAADFQPDVVHLNGYVHADLPWDCPVLVAAHSDVLSWFQSVRGIDAGPDWNRYRQAVGRGLRKADVVIAPSQAMLRALTFYYGPLNQTLVIPNGLRPQSCVAHQKENFILSAGRLWDDAKNLKILAAASTEISWPIYCAGAWEKEFEGLHLLGKLDRETLFTWYARASIYALPALYEPFGYTALEAAQMGCGLVLGDIASLREVWQDAAVYVAPRDPDAWAFQLNALSRDESRLRSLGDAAQKRARLFSTAKMTQLYVRAYDQLLQNKPTCGLLSSVTLCDLTGTTEMPTSSAGS